MSTTQTQRIVLAYSGDLSTSVAIPWLAERYHAEIITVTLDLGQARELTDVRERALAAGAVRAHVIDAREEFVRDYVLPALQAGALSAVSDPLGASLARALIARRLVDVARMESAPAVAYGSGLDELVRAADPSLAAIAMVKTCDLSAADLVAYARERNIAVAGNVRDDRRVNANLWGRSVKRDALEGNSADQEEIYSLTRSAGDCGDEPAYLEIDFERGVPVRANGIEMPMLELIESLDIIGGSHGVGRIEAIDGGENGPARAMYEAPAAALLRTAHREIEKLVIPGDLDRLKEELARLYARLTQGGHWFSPTREAIDGFVRTIQARVTGSVRLRLFKTECEVVSRQSTLAVQRGTADGTGTAWQPAAAEGLVS